VIDSYPELSDKGERSMADADKHEATIDLRAIIIFQAAGIFFLLFYYSELILVTRNTLFPTMPMGESINTFLISVYRASNVIQKSLVDNYAILIVLALASVAAVFLLLAMTSLRRGNISVVARAIFFLALGLCAIPFVLLLWTLRWLPVYLLNIGVNIFTFISSWVGWFFQIILPPFFILVGGILAIILVVTLLRHGWGRLLLLVMAVAILGFVTLGGDIQSVLSALGALGGALKTVVSYPINAISFILSFIVAALGFVLVFSFVTAVAMLIVSQFGHILVDSLFDARNVRKSARSGGK
jgi:hypothetical protein